MFQARFLLFFLSLAAVGSHVVIGASKGTGPPTETDYIPCSETCDGGDVNYNLTASVRTMKLMDYTYRGRTFSTEGSDSFMGPTMRVKPGQSIWIKMINNMDDASMGPNDVTVDDYWKMLQNPGEKIKYQYYKKTVADPSLMQVDTPNIPKNFDVTNLHLHGLDIEVHMFDPVNTHNPDASHIAIRPGECYCYRFNVPDHQPGGLYWYHPHLHGSAAVQIWSGMLGLLYVEGPLEDELARYGITNSHEFVIWDPAFKSVDKTTHNLEVDEFLMGQTTLSKIHPFLVNGKMTPNFEVGVGEVLHLRSLCATIENENTFIVYPEGMENEHWDDAAVPFWIIASDGVTYRQARRHTIIVMAGGQREEILLQFDKPGKYVISQQGIEGMQFFDMYGHPHNQILATITVGETVRTQLPTMPISEMSFTPGYLEEESIRAHDIVATETIVFSMGANRDMAPFPQYYVNGKPYDPNRIDLTAEPGDAREYILINANHNVHPFHIHVNRFQVKEMGSELSTQKYPVLGAVLDFDPDAWRDTVIVPANGRTRIWVQYKNYTGKTVFHCHFLAHEDTGMMSTLFIGPQDYIFHWRDHIPLLMGVAAGMALASIIILCTYFYYTRWGEPTLPYEAVAMNELKSKAVD
jgi:FtsP/CotA-like multicopper oxidase with cupredoxin domain